MYLRCGRVMRCVPHQITQRVMTTESIRPAIRSDSPIDAARWDPASARRHAVTLARWVSLGSFGLMVCLWLAIMVSTWSVREAALGRATSAASNLSAAFCEQVYHTLSTISAAMDFTARHNRTHPTRLRVA